LIYIQRTKVS